MIHGPSNVMFMAVICIFDCNTVSVLINADWPHVLFPNNDGYFFDRIGQNKTYLIVNENYSEKY